MFLSEGGGMSGNTSGLLKEEAARLALSLRHVFRDLQHWGLHDENAFLSFIIPTGRLYRFSSLTHALQAACELQRKPSHPLPAGLWRWLLADFLVGLVWLWPLGTSVSSNDTAAVREHSVGAPMMTIVAEWRIGSATNFEHQAISFTSPSDHSPMVWKEMFSSSPALAPPRWTCAGLSSTPWAPLSSDVSGDAHRLLIVPCLL